MDNDRKYLRKAVSLAAEGIKKGCGPFGAIIVYGDKIIARANNRVVLSSDPTAHAEIVAIRKAASRLGSHDLSACVLYTSCEPCPMCLGALYWAGIRRVVYASTRYDAASAGFSDNEIYNEIALDPEKRKVEFLRIDDAGGSYVFRMWNDFEDKTPY
ncbi:MAG: nucleoside deaminase [Bacteroidales bacterium]|mgnify:FL=1|jgi:tRNA(Arg) A34 adenosine deaminase TadA|nr:nucleoside deaminase [Bacteroidales bacterium]